jgi:hemoglobin
MLLQTNSYKGDMMGTHFELNEHQPLKPEHFKRWIELLQQTANKHYSGPKTTELLSRANTIAQLMSYKLNSSE